MNWSGWFCLWASEALVASSVTPADGWLCAVAEAEIYLPFGQGPSAGSFSAWKGWKLEQALLLGKVSPGCSLTGIGPLKSHLSQSFSVVMTDTTSFSHLMLKLMWLFTVGFPFSFVLRVPEPFFFFLKKNHPKYPLGFPTPSEAASPSF